MRIYIACLAAYNNGHLHGQWFDVAGDVETIQENINSVLSTSPIKDAEEWAIHDYEGPRVLVDQLGENPGLQTLVDVQAFLDAVDSSSVDEADRDAFIDAMLDGQELSDIADIDVDEWIAENYAGEGDTLKDWCETFLDETDFFGDIPKGDDRLCTIARYFDYESYARDMRLGGDIHETRSNGRVLVFWNH